MTADRGDFHFSDEIWGCRSIRAMGCNPHPPLLRMLAGVLRDWPRFNARIRADNFPDDELADVVAFLHSHGVNAHQKPFCHGRLTAV